VLHTEAEVTAVRGSASRPESGLVTFRITTRQQDGKAVQVFTPTVIVPRRPA
jgi:acyl dehydratase